MAAIKEADSPMCIHCLKRINKCLCELDGLPGLLRAEVKQSPETPQADVALNDLLKRKAVLEGAFRLIISHKMMGCDCDMDKADYDEMVSDLVNAAA